MLYSEDATTYSGAFSPLPPTVPDPVLGPGDKSILPLSSVFLLNVQGMNPATDNQRWKIKDISESLQSASLHTPFFFLTETHLKPYILDAEVNIENYTAFRADRADRIRGGSAIYLHSTLNADSSNVFSNSYCEASVIYNKASNTLLACIYRPPAAPFSKFSECLEFIENFIDSIASMPEILITGDFNFPFIDWDTGTIPSGASISLSDRQSALAFLCFSEELFLEQIVREPTRADKNILDLVLTNNSDLIHSVTVSKTLKSDHDVVSLQLLHPEFQLSPTLKPEFKPSCLLDDINFNSANWDAIRNDLSSVDWQRAIDLSSTDQDLAWRTFEDMVASVCQKHAPSHSHSASKSTVKGLPRHRALLLRRKRRLNARINAIKYKSPRGINSSKLSRLQDDRASIELLMKEDLLSERARKEIDAIGKMKKNPKAFYSYAKQSARYKAPVGPLLDDKEELQSDPTSMANILQNQYQKAFSDPTNGKADGYVEPDAKTEEHLDDIIISDKDVLDAISETQSSSAPGPDKFPSIILKECKDILASPIRCMWQNSLESGNIAAMFKIQSITPIFKKGNKALPVNYRPVSLTSHLIKLFERIVRKRMVSFIEAQDLFDANQHGFRSGKNCLTQLLHHIDDIMHDLCNDHNADVLYLDFSKAFDKVDHGILMKKLRAFGIRGKLLRWIKSFLTDRQQFVVVEGHESAILLVLSGVPQGTVLGPLLFLIYINDIGEVVNHCKIKIFADDSKLHKTIKTLLDRFHLQEDLGNVVKWAEDNNMELNPDKYELLQHGKNTDLKLPYVLPSGQTLKDSGCVRDLGVFVDSDLSWRSHISLKVDKSKSMASWVLRTIKARDSQTMLLLFKSYVRTHVEYCSPLWSPHLQCDIIRIEAVQRTFTSKIKNVTGLSYWDRLKRLSLYSLQRRRERFAIILIWKIYHGLVPNSMNIQFRETSRHGTVCIRPLGSSKYSSTNTKVFNSFASSASALYNVVPHSIKSHDTLASFKRGLDVFLKSVPDTPPTPGYVALNNNSILEWAGCTNY